jgi:hypothetical protein
MKFTVSSNKRLATKNVKVFVICVSLSKLQETANVHPNFELDGQGSIPDKEIFFIPSLQAGSGAHSALYPMHTGCKAVGA